MKALQKYQHTQTVLKADNTVDTLTRTIFKKVDVDMFIKTYIDDICTLAKCSGAEQSIVLCSLQYVDYNTNEIVFNASRRKEIALCANIKENTFNVCILRLYKKFIFIKINTSTGMKTYLNPKLFFFGTDLERDKILKLTISYKIK